MFESLLALVAVQGGVELTIKLAVVNHRARLIEIRQLALVLLKPVLLVLVVVWLISACCLLAVVMMLQALIERRLILMLLLLLLLLFVIVVLLVLRMIVDWNEGLVWRIAEQMESWT